MCDRCGWRDLIEQIGKALIEAKDLLPEHQREWMEAIRVTVDDDRHSTDHQKTVIKRILRERGIEHWRQIPKAMDKTKWSDAKKKHHVERKKLARRLRQYGGF